MFLKSSKRRTPASSRQTSVRHRFSFETLENRMLMAGDLSISDATAIEGSAAMKFIDNFIAPRSGDLQFPRGIDVGPDGNLYINSDYDPSNPGQMGSVNRYDAETGQFIDQFASHPTMIHAKDVEFGPDGNLYVPTATDHNVFRFNGLTGEYMDVFIPTGSGGLAQPRSLKFGPDGNLYVTSAANDSVLRYDGATGAFVDAFVPAGSGGLNDPTAIVFGPDGNLYIASGAHTNFNNGILRYNGTTGAFMGVFVATGSAGLTLAPTAGVIFGPDVNGDGSQDLYVSNSEVDEVLIYSGANGSFLQKFIPPGLGGLDDPKGLLFDSDGNLLVVANGDESVRRYGPASHATFTVSLSAPSSEPVTVNFATADGSANAGSDYVADFGTITFAPGQTSHKIVVQTLDGAVYEGNQTFVVNLSNPTDGVIADSQGVATIQDNDPPPTKFYVVNDGSPDRTYEYGATGAAIENYAINGGNTAPRGAASTPAGDKVWVIDANRKVYVYNASGGLLGSWTPGGLNASAQLEGIATDGVDIWLVDAKSDKVFKYTGAATRLSGSQNASSSFSLNSGNGNPTDLVTNGSSIWVVNDSSSDKVFKYAIGGMLLGSWTISSAGGSPTGITIDPTNVSDIWIVDNATDRVYQYTAAATRTSGSQSPASSFALAAGNTNPQGIADPRGLPGTVLSVGLSSRMSHGSHSRPTLLAAIDFLFAEPDSAILTKPRRPRLAWV